MEILEREKRRIRDIQNYPLVVDALHINGEEHFMEIMKGSDYMNIGRFIHALMTLEEQVNKQKEYIEQFQYSLKETQAYLKIEQDKNNLFSIQLEKVKTKEG